METKHTSHGQPPIPAERLGPLDTPPETAPRADMDHAATQTTLPPVTREFVRSLRGKYKGKGLMKALMEEKGL